MNATSVDERLRQRCGRCGSPAVVSVDQPRFYGVACCGCGYKDRRRRPGVTPKQVETPNEPQNLRLFP